MAKAVNKTVENDGDVQQFLESAAEGQKLADCRRLVEIFARESGYKAKMWGPAIVGFGSYHYVYESGREGDAPMAGFSPRKQDLTLYLATAYNGRDALMEKFGKHKASKACIYIKKLSDIDEGVLRQMVRQSVAYMKEKY